MTNPIVKNKKLTKLAQEVNPNLIVYCEDRLKFVLVDNESKNWIVLGKTYENALNNLTDKIETLFQDEMLNHG